MSETLEEKAKVEIHKIDSLKYDCLICGSTTYKRLKPYESKIWQCTKCEVCENYDSISIRYFKRFKDMLR